MNSTYSSSFFFLMGQEQINEVGANIISEPTQNMLSHGSSWMLSRFGTTEDNIFMGTRNKLPYCNMLVFKTVFVYWYLKKHRAEWLFLSSGNFITEKMFQDWFITSWSWNYKMSYMAGMHGIILNDESNRLKWSYWLLCCFFFLQKLWKEIK